MFTGTKAKLCDICTISSGAYLHEPAGNEVCYLQVSDLYNESFCDKSKRIAYRPQLDGYLLQRGDVLLVCKGASFKCRVYDCEHWAIASTSFLVLRITCSHILPEYLCWYLNHPRTVEIIHSRQEGSGTPMIRKADIEDLLISIPDLERQSEIIRLSELSQRETELMKEITTRKELLMNHILYKAL